MTIGMTSALTGRPGHVQRDADQHGTRPSSSAGLGLAQPAYRLVPASRSARDDRPVGRPRVGGGDHRYDHSGHGNRAAVLATTTVMRIKPTGRASGTSAGSAGTRTGSARRAPRCGSCFRTRSTAGRGGGRRRPRPRGRPRAAPGPGLGRAHVHGVDPPGADAVVPSAPPGRARSTRMAAAACSRAQRVEPVPEQHLGAVDVADAGEHRLVHQQPPIGGPAAR